MTFLLLTKKRWPTFLSIWSQSNKRINLWTHRFVLCNAGIFSFSSFAFGPKFSSKIMASAALNITFSRCVCLHPEYENLFERSFRICSIYTRNFGNFRVWQIVDVTMNRNSSDFFHRVRVKKRCEIVKCTYTGSHFIYLYNYGCFGFINCFL